MFIGKTCTAWLCQPRSTTTGTLLLIRLPLRVAIAELTMACNEMGHCRNAGEHYTVISAGRRLMTMVWELTELGIERRPPDSKVKRLISAPSLNHGKPHFFINL